MNTETRGTLSRRGEYFTDHKCFRGGGQCFFQHFHRIYHRILCSLTRTAIRQHPDAPFKYQPEHCHPRFIRSGHIPVGNPSANMDQCRFLFCNDTEHPSTGKCISDHGTEAAPSNWNCNIDRQDCKYRRRKWLFVHRQSKRHQQPGPLRRLKFHLLRSIRPPDHTFIPPPQPARPHYTCNHTDRKHPTSDNSVSCAVIVTESLLWLHNFFKYLPQFHHELRLL